MFLVYGQLSDRGKLNRKTGKRDPPTVCFFAHPLVDQASFSEQILLNSRTMEALGHGPDDDDIQPDIDHDNHIQYKDPAVDAIMNGSDDHVNDDGQESGYGSDWIPPFDIKEDDDESLQQEMELLKALERSKTWSPYPSSNVGRSLLGRNAL